MPSLDEVTQEFLANTLPYVEAMADAIEIAEQFAAANHEALTSVAELQAGIDALHGKDISIDVDLAGAASAAGADAALAALNGQVGEVRDSLDSLAADTLADSAVMIAALNRVDSSLSDMAQNTAMDAAVMMAALNGVRSALGDMAADSAADAAVMIASLNQIAGAATAVAAGTAAAGAGAAAAGNRFRILGTGLTLTGTAIHWILAGTFEFLAVAIPAFIAAGDAAAVMAQGVGDAYEHFMAMYTVVESVGPAVGATVGSFLGLKSALQQAQNTADPMVWEILGSAINDAKANFQGFAFSGLAVTRVLDEFSARVTVDLQDALGSDVHGLLSNMVTDLTEFGQIFGNIGHAILSFASAMPGLAEELLSLADSISKVIEWVSQLPPWLITTVMAMEEFYRWGGLLAKLLPMIASGLVALPGAAINGFLMVLDTGGQILAAFTQGIGILINGVGRLMGMVPIFSQAGASVEQFGAELTYLGNISPVMFTALAAGAASVVLLGMALDHFRNPAEQFIDSANQAISAATDLTVLQTIAEKVAGANAAIASQEAILRTYPGYMQQAGEATAGFVTTLQGLWSPLGGAAEGALNLTSKFHTLSAVIGITAAPLTMGASLLLLLGNGASESASQISQLSAAEQKWLGEAQTVSANAEGLAHHLGVSLPAAAALASMAGVQLNQVWARGSGAFDIALQQIRNLTAGWAGMSAPAGVLGNDLNAVAVQAGLASSRVSQLTQAWDQMFSLVSGGIGTFSQLIMSVRTMRQDTASSSVELSGQFSSISTGASTAAYSLKGLGQNTMQSLQQVGQALSNGNTQMDFFQNALTMGAIKMGAFQSAAKDIVGILVPFAKGNAAVEASLDLLAQRGGAHANMTLQQLAAWAGVHGPAAMKALESAVNDASTQMSNMSAVAQNLGTTMSGQVTSSLSSAALDFYNFQGAALAAMNAVHKYGINSSQAQTAIASLNNDQVNAAKLAHEVAGAMNTANGSIRGVGNSALTAAGQMSQAARQAFALAHNIANLPDSKTITITTAWVSVGGPPAAYYHGQAGHAAAPGYGYASGGDVPYSGFALVGEEGPEIRWLNAGDHISTAPDSQRIMSAGHGPTEMVNHIHVHLDGEEIFSSQQRATLDYDKRNGAQFSGAMAPG